MFPGYLQDFSRMFSGCSNGSCGPGGIWWTFQMKGIRSSPTIWWPQLIDDRQLFDDKLEVWTLIIQNSTVIPPSLMVLFSSNSGLLTYPINGCILYIHQHSCSWKICGQKILKFKDRSGWHSAKNEETMLQPLEPPIKHDETQKRSGKKKDYVQNQWPPTLRFRT